MNALHDRHVQLWVIALLVMLSLVGGLFIGMRSGTPTVVYDYTVALEGSGEDAPVALEYGIWPALAQVDFFNTVRERFIEQKAHFVEANLTAMELQVYRDGVVALTVPIKSKGREGSWWETPAGLYSAQSKEDTHYSSFGHVYMPYSIPFQGNFFIHGWPYHADGTPVAEGYSGGCIRLEDAYAQQVYALVEVGMPILVYEEPASASAFTYELDAPQLNTNKYLVADLDTHFVLLGSGTEAPAHTRVLPMLMTALIASEYQNIEKEVTVPTHTIPVASTTMLTPGARYSIYDLFFPLLRSSDAVAARALGAYFGAERFVRLQNDKARALGMTNTVFADAAGDSGENRTTVEDVFTLLKYLVSNRSFLLAMSAGTVNTRTYGESVFSGATSTHPLIDTESFVGGLADALYPASVVSEEGADHAAAVALLFARFDEDAPQEGADMVSVVRVPFSDGTERTLAVIVLDSRDPATDTTAMLAHVRELYR